MASKSILKVKDAPAGSILSTVPQSNERNRELAIHHANLIQDQKDAQNEVFESMMNLIDLPTNAASAPEDPEHEDVESLTQNLKIFAPSDFDELIQERHANGRCGYPLCPRPYKKQSTTAKFRILGKASDMKIVSTDSLENWCSETCARRAMYLKVQLSDEPAWLRTSAPDITVMPENGQSLSLRPKPVSSGVTDEREIADGLRRTHIGSQVDAAHQASGQLIRQDVLERDTTRPAAAPDFDAGASDLVEGHKSAASKTRTDSSGEDDEDEDTDWRL